MMDGEGSGLVDAAPSRLPTAALSGLPLALVLTNPAFEDNPIVYANPAFARLTGYTLEAVIGRNCRFLQGPATEPDRVARIRAATRGGRGHRDRDHQPPRRRHALPQPPDDHQLRDDAGGRLLPRHPERRRRRDRREPARGGADCSSPRSSTGSRTTWR